MASRVYRVALLVACVSAGLRLTWVLLAHVTQLSDFALYERLAVDWVRTGRFGSYGSYAYRTPGYPAFIAAVYAVAGQSPRVVGLVQALLGGATSGMLVLLAARFFPLPVSALAGLLHALSPTNLPYVPVLASENLAVPLLVGSLLCLAAAGNADGRRRAGLVLASGTLLGLLVLVRPAGSLFIAAWAVLAAYSPVVRRRYLLGPLLVLAAVAVVLLPWVVRNCRRGIGPVISSATAQNLWIGNNDMAYTGGWCRGALNLQGISERDQISRYQRQTLEWVAEHPWRYVELSWTRFVRFMGTEPDVWAAAYLTPTRENNRLIARFFRALEEGEILPRDVQLRNEIIQGRNVRWLRALRVLVAPLILIALALSFLEWRRHAIFVWPAICYVAGISLTFAEARFRVLLDPLLLVPLAAFIWRVGCCYSQVRENGQEEARAPDAATEAAEGPAPEGEA
jgi:hypothetical protein